MAGKQDLVLDPQIRDWVLIPITLVMLLVGILRHYVVQLMNTAPKPPAPAIVREQQILLRGSILRQNASVLPVKSFERREKWLEKVYKDGRYLRKNFVSRDMHTTVEAPALGSKGGSTGAAAPSAGALPDMSAMEGMMDGMKKQMVMYIPQTILMGWITTFFSGFVVLKLPFPLTEGFKPMLQSGLEAPNLDVRWVSSLSWYFLNLFGLNSIYSLILGDSDTGGSMRDAAMGPLASLATNANAGANPMAMMMGGGANATQDNQKLFDAERENLKLIHHQWILHGIEDRFLARFERVDGTTR